MTDSDRDWRAVDALATGSLPDNAPIRGLSGEDRVTDDAQNVTLEQTSSTTWDILVVDTGVLVGRVAHEHGSFHAYDADGGELGDYDSVELALFGVVNPN
jgi:hypothetical protein